MDEKPCKKCGEIKPLTMYSPDKRASDGRQGRCKQCATEAHKKRYWDNPEKARAQKAAQRQANPEKYRQYDKTKRERHADKIAARKKEYYQKKKKDPVWQAERAWKYKQVRPERLEYLRDYCRKNSEIAVARAKKWKEDNLERARASARNSAAKRHTAISSGIPIDELKDWTDKAEKVCYWCGIGCEDRFHVDHYQPLAKGGDHAIYNLVIACVKCNLKKNARDPYEFANEVGRLF